VLAYPFGGRDDITTDGVLAAKEAGYSALVSNFGGENVPGDDPFCTRRIDLGGDHDAVMWQAAALGLDLSKWKRRLGREERSPGSQPASSKRSAERRGIRVTHIVFDLDGGGMEALVAAMAARWHDADVRLSIVTLSGRIGRVGRTVQSLVEQFQVPRVTPGVSLISPSAIVRALRATRADVVHLHTGAWLKGAYAAALAGVGRVIYTEHGREHYDPLTARLQDKIALQLTDSVVAVSERLRTYMIREIGVRPSRAHTIPNGVDTAVFAPSAPRAPLRASLRIPDDALVLGSVGRLEPVKGYVRLVEVYARLRTMGIPRPLVLVLFGEGSDREAIEREAERLGVRDGIRMPGWTERAAEAHRLFDVFAMTSHSEGMSVSLMEAMACGVCPVVTDVGSNAEVVGDRLRSHVVAGNDIDAFASVVADLLRSDQRRHDAGRTARAHAVAHHSFDRMMEAYEKLYRGEPVPSEAVPHAAIATA
jgi:glycosyltransferase involved in cell wall biosynthesis